MIYSDKLYFDKMKLEDVYKFKNWGKHSISLYDDYNFYEDSKKDIEDWFSWKTHGRRVLYFTIFEEGEPIGYLSFKRINKFFKTAVLGIVLNPDKVSCGYGTEILLRMLSYYFNEMNFSKIYLSVAGYNDRAKRLYKKMGFRKYSSTIYFYPNGDIDFSDVEYTKFKKYFLSFFGKLFFYADKMILDRNTFNEVVKCISN